MRNLDGALDAASGYTLDWRRNRSSKGAEMEHDENLAKRSECYCETCTDRAAWEAQD